MATYQLVGGLAAGVIGLANRWSAVIQWNVQSSSGTEITLLDTDGTLTKITGSGFTLDGANHALTGTVTGVSHLLSGGAVTTETISGANVALTSFETNVATAIGGTLSGNDTINGSPNLVQLLFGYGGADTFVAAAPSPDAFGRSVVQYVGGGGADTFGLGGATVDDVTVNYSLEPGVNPITVNLAAGTATDTFGATDTLNGITTVIATGFNDSLTGGAGDDTFAPGSGADTIDGGAGFDQIVYNFNALLGTNYFNYATGITATFTGVNAGTVIDPTGATDTFTNVERVRGTNFHDVFNGGPGDDSFRGMGGADTFIGGAGSDEVDYRSDVIGGGLLGVTVNLATGTATDGFGDTDTLSSIERIRGTRFADTITGDSNANRLGGEGGDDTLNGGDGNDDLRPGAGTDTVIGGAGFDRLNYQFDTGANGVTITVTSLGAGTAIDRGGATDTFSQMEQYQGTDAADTFTGTSNFEEWVPGRGADTVNGGGGGDTVRYDFDDSAGSGISYVANATGGTVTSAYFGTDTLTNFYGIIGSQLNDTLTGGARDELFMPSLGQDTIDGGAGFDRLEYWDFRNANLPTGIIVNMGATLGSGVVFDAGTQQDTFSNIELIRGGQRNDVFNGASTAIIFSGLGGNNTFNGGSGFMTVDYSSDASFGATMGIVVNLGSTGTNGFGGTDTYVNIDRVNGGLFNDVITGSVEANFLYGNGGDDRLDGAAGADTMDGGAGNDTYYVDNTGDVIVEASGAGTDVAYVSAGVYTVGAFVESIYGTNAGGQTIVANDQDNLLQGAGGSNILYGMGGNDLIISGATASTLDGGAGNDALYGGAGADYMIGGDGDDIIVGFGGADSMYGGAGNDYIVASDGAGSVVDGGAGANTLYGAGGADYIVGGEGADLLVGGAGSDYEFGNAGDDTLYGGQGTDFLYTNAGNDFVWTDDVGLPQSQDFIYAGGGTGVDTIADFTAGDAANHDVLVVSPASGVTNFAQLMANTVQVGVYSVITLGADQVYLYNVQPFQLTAADFLFF